MTTATTLSDRSRALYDFAASTAGGAAGWRQRKKVEARLLLELAERAGPKRLDVLLLDLAEDLRTVVRLGVPVPLRPGPDGSLPTAPAAVLGVGYPRLALTRPVPGFAFVTLLEPSRGAFHPNIGRVRGQRLCLGSELPPGIPVTELILLSYGLLSLQSVTLDPDDAAGVMNDEAARWWQQNTDRIPLTREAFIGPAQGSTS